MRLARPVYESLPYVYMVMGGLAIFLFYIDPVGPRAAIAFVLGGRGRNGGLDAAFAAPGLPRLEPRVFGRDHRPALESAKLSESRLFMSVAVGFAAAQARLPLIDVHDFVLPHLHHVAVVQVMTPHAFGLHENAVGAVEILDQAGIGLRHDLAVMTADELAVDLYIVVRSPADHQTAGLELALASRSCLRLPAESVRPWDRCPHRASCFPDWECACGWCGRRIRPTAALRSRRRYLPRPPYRGRGRTRPSGRCRTGC